MNLKRWIIWPVKTLWQMQWVALWKGIIFSINSKKHQEPAEKQKLNIKKDVVWSILLMVLGLLNPEVELTLPWVQFCLGHLSSPLNSSLHASNWASKEVFRGRSCSSTIRKRESDPVIIELHCIEQVDFLQLWPKNSFQLWEALQSQFS